MGGSELPVTTRIVFPSQARSCVQNALIVKCQRRQENIRQSLEPAATDVQYTQTCKGKYSLHSAGDACMNAKDIIGAQLCL